MSKPKPLVNPRKAWRIAAARRRAERRAKELTLKEVAAKIGVGFTRLHRWEHGMFRCPVELAAKWDAALKEAK